MSEAENQENQQTEVQVATEKKARTLGWVPKEDFRDGDHWVDAETFVKRGDEINPILRKNNETLLKKLDQANREIAEVKQIAKEFEKFQKAEANRVVADLEIELKELKERKKEATIAGNGVEIVALEDAIDVVKEQQQAAKKEESKTTPEVAVPKTLDPIVTGWMEKNEWFTADLALTKTADYIGVRINEEHPELNGQAFFDKLDEELALVLPEKYKKKPRSSPVEGNTNAGGKRSSGSNKHTFDNLPDDAKVTCDRMIKQGYKMTREQYVDFYDWT